MIIKIESRSLPANFPAVRRCRHGNRRSSGLMRPIEFWSTCHATYGDTFTVQLGSQGPTVLFCDPLAVKEIFALSREHYTCGKYNEHYGLIMGTRSLLVLDGDDHSNQRRLLTPQFAADTHTEWRVGLTRQISKQAESWQRGDIIRVRHFVHTVIFEQMLGFLFGGGQTELCKLLRNIFLKDLTKDYGTWSPWSRFTKWHPLLRKGMHRAIKRIRSGAVTAHGLFAQLATYRESDGTALSAEQIEDHVFTMLIAGVDPTTLSTTWTLFWIHESPEVLDVLARELASTGDGAEASAQVSWLDATIKESLRMYPVVTTPTGRRLTQETPIVGRTYPAETTLLPCTYLVHRRPSLYERPNEFRPERFQRGTYRHYEYFPFGGGLRTCIGAKLAIVTIKTIVAEVLRTAEFESFTSGDVVPVRHGTLLAPSENFRLRVVRRLPSLT